MIQNLLFYRLTIIILLLLLSLLLFVVDHLNLNTFSWRKHTTATTMYRPYLSQMII